MNAQTPPPGNIDPVPNTADLVVAVSRAWARGTRFNKGGWRRDKRKATLMRSTIAGSDCALSFTHKTYNYMHYSPKRRLESTETRHYFYLHFTVGNRVHNIAEKLVRGDRQARCDQVLALWERKAEQCFGFVPTWII